MTVDSGDSRKELLILGGSPSIAKPIIETVILKDISKQLFVRTQNNTYQS
jgi:hypothetical protein